MTDEMEKKEETSEQQQSHRRKSIEEQAEEISDVKVPPFIVILIGAILIIGLIVALIKFVPSALKDNKKFVSKTKIEENGKDGEKVDPKTDKRPEGNYKIVKAPENPKIKIKTNKGDITVELFEDKAPNSVANFVELCNKKFYNDIRFHRIIKNFMIQTGCPNARHKIGPGAGTGDAGYKLADEIWKGQTFSSEKGLLAWANGGAGTNSNGSQFFITDTILQRPDLDMAHPIFGKVIEGLDVVDKIADTPVKRIPGAQDAPPTEDVYIISTEILQLRDHAYVSEKITRR